ncbi:Fc.00g114070.m01.CDS01 [Cosmosporella sp. VM-42]
MATVTPAPAHIPLFDRPKLRKQQREVKARMQDKLREQAALEAQEIAKFETFDFLMGFLHGSEWKDLSDSITIAWDVLPTMQELQTLGRLDKVEGTRACRKLFKVAVVWDDLGCSLWERLSGNAARNKSVSSQDTIWEEESNGDTEHEQECLCPDTAVPALSRVQSKSSRTSRESASSSRSRHASSERQTQEDRPSSSSLCKCRNPKPSRRSTEPLPGSFDTHSLHHKDSRYGLPRLISNNCANAVKRTLGGFGDSMIQGHGGRGNM